MNDITMTRIKHHRSKRTAVIIRQNVASVRVRFDDGEGGEQTIPLEKLHRDWREHND